jgi:transposase
MARDKDIVSEMEPVHGMSQIQHRRRWAFFQKLQVVQETSVAGMTVTAVAKKYGMAPSQLFRWKKLLLNAGEAIVSASDQGSAGGELQELKRRVRELERLLGRATLENEILRETIAQRKSTSQPGKNSGPLTDRYR